MHTNSLATKPHYAILDGLRGVAAILVVIFHIFEAHSPGRFYQIINHGYLAVDFFFLLSGFVVAYAYDDRWSQMTVGGFFKRRLIRLQPMVLAGAVIGAICFYLQPATALWPVITTVPVWKVLLMMLIGFTMLPVPTSMDIRGWIEMYPLNGPAWSLFYEYVANIFYALFVRKFSTRVLSILVLLSAAALVHYTVMGPTGDVIGGWSLEPMQIKVGFTRMMFPFFGGLLLCRVAKLIKVQHAFFWCSVLLVIVLSVPRFGGEKDLWMNGLYESLIIIVIFPLIVLLGAGGEIKGAFAAKICKFFGDISYPIYITHYPLIYLYTAWVIDNKPSWQRALPIGLLVLSGAILIAYACLRLYDEPVRKWLKQKVMLKQV